MKRPNLRQWIVDAVAGLAIGNGRVNQSWGFAISLSMIGAMCLLMTGAMSLLMIGAMSGTALAASCSGDSAHFEMQHKILLKIFEEDQADRANFETMRDEAVERMVARDRVHLKLLNTISSEHCLKSAADYSMGAKLMMHMGKPAQLLQAYSWAKKAQDLGDQSASARITLSQSIDRYLVLKGYRQLFASQARQDSEARCWCLNSVQKDFPDSRRVDYGGRDLDGAFTWVDDMNRGLGCHIGRYCKDNLKSTPKGIAPGIW